MPSPVNGVSESRTIDYSAVLADLQAKFAAIQNAIAGIQAMMQSGAHHSEGVLRTETAVSFNGHIAPNAFFGKSIPVAAKLYLQAVRTKQTTQEIADALQRGGMETTSGNFTQTVAAGLNRASRETAEIVKGQGGKWGLPEWFGRIPKKKATLRPSSKGRKPQETLPQRVVRVLKTKPETVFSPAEIRGVLGENISTKDLGSALTRLVKSGRAVRVGVAQYRAAA